MTDAISAVWTERDTAALDSSPSGSPSGKSPSMDETKHFSRPMTAPDISEQRCINSPRVRHLEDLGFLSNAVHQDGGIDYYHDIGEAQLRKTLAVRAHRPWTQESAAPDPNKIDRDEQVHREQKEREQRRQKHKAKFALRPESPGPTCKTKPIFGLPSSPNNQKRKEIRAEVELNKER